MQLILSHHIYGVQLTYIEMLFVKPFPKTVNMTYILHTFVTSCEVILINIQTRTDWQLVRVKQLLARAGTEGRR